jgi:tellurite resistance protein TerC
MTAILLWIGFFALVLTGLSLDLGVFNRTPRVIRTREAFAWTGFWITLALSFTIAVYYIYELDLEGFGIQSMATDLAGKDAVFLFLAGYLTEYSLSLDNIVVIALVFSYFRVPLAYQHRVLFWGVLGALVMRFIMIVAGAALIHQFTWITYVFGAFLIVSAARMLVATDDHLEPEKNAFVRLAERLFPVHDHFHGHHFFVEVNGKRFATRLFIVLVLVESSDLIFAIDSIPAIFAITTEPFIVVTSNVFAIMGLRSLYFALAPLMDRFRYLKMSLVFLLGFVGVKLVLAHHFEISPVATLGAIVGIVAVGALASVVAANRPRDHSDSPVTLMEREQLRGLTPRGARRVAVLVIFTSCLAVGAGVVLLPGPIWVLLPAGVALIAAESYWARRLFHREEKHPAGDSTEESEPRGPGPSSRLRSGTDRAPAGEEAGAAGGEPAEEPPSRRPAQRR